MNRFIDELYPMEEREAAGLALNLPAWQVPLWDAIHFWAAHMGRDLMKKHVAALMKRWGRIPPQCEAVVLVERVVERAVAAERVRIREELLEDAPNWLPVAADNERPNVDDFRAALDRALPEGVPGGADIDNILANEWDEEVTLREASPGYARYAELQEQIDAQRLRAEGLENLLVDTKGEIVRLRYSNTVLAKALRGLRAWVKHIPGERGGFPELERADAALARWAAGERT